MARRTNRFANRHRKILSRCGGAAAAVILALPVQALEYQIGEVSGSIDTTLSIGGSWRAQDRDPSLIGKANNVELATGTPVSGLANTEPGAFSVNIDDGNMNYDKNDAISSIVKVTQDIGMSWDNLGAFVRWTAFHDFTNYDFDETATGAERPDVIESEVGRDIDLLDAYVSANFELGGLRTNLRVGKQVVSWGESTFIQNSINSINPVYVPAFRRPGAEIKEGLLPVNLAYASMDLSDLVNMELFYQLEWERTEIDPRGTYFSGNDFAGIGGEKIYFGFGRDDETLATLVGTRTPDKETRDDGQYGAAIRILVPQLNLTEFGFYGMNYHSRLPLIGVRAVAAPTPDPDGQLTAVEAFVEYPEDIKLYGISFNTILDMGLSIGGEVSYRQDMPLQVEDLELLFAAASSIEPFLAPFDIFENQLIGTSNASAGDEFGFRNKDVAQAQATFTYVFGASNPFKANQWVVLSEVGVTKVMGMEDKSELRYNAPGTSIMGGLDNEGNLNPGEPPLAPLGASPERLPDDVFADDVSWGYRLLTRVDYNSVFGLFNMSPRLAFAHDVKGTTPGPGGSFVEGRKSGSVGIGFDYLSTWSADLSLTKYFHADHVNSIEDRDFYAVNVKYSF